MSLFHLGYFFRSSLGAARILAAAAVFCGLVAVTAAPPAHAQWDESEGFEFITQVQRNGRTISTALFGLQVGIRNPAYYIPVKELAQLAGFVADVDLAQGVAEGWFLSEQNTYRIDTQALSYTIGGETFPLSPADFIVRDYGGGFGDIFIRLETLNQIWPLELNVIPNKLVLAIETPRKLPVELRQERLERQEAYLTRRGELEVDTTGFIHQPHEYKMFTKPVFDIDNTVNYSSEEQEVAGNLRISGTSDLLGFSADYNLNVQRRDGVIDWPDNLRLILEKQAFDDPMPLGIRNLRIGDVSARTADLINGSNGGRGFVASSRPLRRNRTFDEITVEGEATPGWDIELYRNSDLLNFGVVGDDGFYRFDDITLLSGTNRIRVLLYGPQGQIDERVEEYNIASSLLAPGDTEYEVSVVDTSSNFITFNTEDTSAPNRSADESGLAYSASVLQGINRHVTLFGTATDSQTRIGKSRYVTAGANLSFLNTYAGIEAYKQLDGEKGRALDVTVSRNLLGWRTNLHTAFMRDFESNRVGFGDRAKVLDAEFRSSRNFQTPAGRLGLSVFLDHEKDLNGRVDQQVRLEQSLNRRGQRYGHSLRARRTDGEITSASSRFDTNLRFGRQWNIRGNLDYQLRPEAQLRSAGADISYRYSDDLRTSVNINHSFPSRSSQFGGSVSYDFGTWLGSINTNWREEQGVDVSLRAFTSLAPYGVEGDYIFDSASMQRQSFLTGQVFLDKNLNGIFDEGDNPLEDAVLMLNGRDIEETDAGGYFRELRAGSPEHVAITYNQDDSPDPFFVSGPKGYVVLLRPGATEHIQYPVVEAGLIDGVAYFESGNPVPGLRIQLVDSEGVVAAQTVTSFDGFYTFETVKPGTYMIQADPTLNVNVPPRTITVGPKNLFSYGVNLQLLEDVANTRVSGSKYISILSNLKKLQRRLNYVTDADTL